MVGFAELNPQNNRQNVFVVLSFFSFRVFSFVLTSPMENELVK